MGLRENNYSIAMKNKFYLGIDIGGTKIRTVFLRGLKKQKVCPYAIKLPKNKKDLFNILNDLIRRAAGNKKIAGIGVGLPGITDSRQRILIKAPNLPFLNGWEVKKFFRKFAKEVKIDNDVNCFLIAEANWGAGRGNKNLIGVARGTGIGGGIIIGGKMYGGKNNSAAEFGHIIIDKGRTLEQLAAKKAFLKFGDRSEIIGIGVANLINAFDPDKVILGGGGVVGGGIKIKTVGRVAKKYIMSPLSKKTPIVRGKLGDAAQAIGAALLFKIKRN